MSALSRYRDAVRRERRNRSAFAAPLVVAARVSYWSGLLPLRFKLGRAALRLRAALLTVAVSCGLETRGRRERLGYVLLSLGRTEARFRSWERAIELGSEDLRITRDVAYYRHGLGDWDGEHEGMRRLVELRERLAARAGLDVDCERYFTVSNFGVMGFLDAIAKQEALAATLPRTVLLANPGGVANATYLDCWREHFPTIIEDADAIERLRSRERLLRIEEHTWRAPDGRLMFHPEAASDVEARWHAEGRPPLVRLPSEAVESGWSLLRSAGIPSDAWFATIHAREDPRWDTVRNVDIRTFDRAVRAVVERGGWVIRLGEPSMTPLEAHRNVFDYAHSELKSDCMDIFLLSQARFVVATESGPYIVAGSFGVPVVETNWILSTRVWFRNHLFLNKLYRSERDGRMLTLEEALATPAPYVQGRSDLAALGITLVDNTAEEIEAAVREMMDVLDGTLVYTSDDDELQRRFHASEPPLRYPLSRGGARVSRDFLRAHADLLS